MALVHQMLDVYLPDSIWTEKAAEYKDSTV